VDDCDARTQLRPRPALGIGQGRLELFEYIHPDAIETEPTRPNEIGMHRVAFSVDDLDAALAVAAGTV
jgi:catechol 2,3-dioxygenase-like lactoylglutathione lyase family enzyme